MTRARATLAQVAALAGVSVSTASLAFSGSGPVSAPTRDRVLAAARKLDYAGPDPRGRSLRQGRSGIIGVILEERVLAAFRDPIRIAVLDGIAEETTSQGRGLLLLSDVGAGVDAISGASMDAAILLGHSTRFGRTVDLLRRRSLPIAAVGGPAHEGVLTISIDDEEASATVARHLAELGHRDAAIVTLPLLSVDPTRPDPNPNHGPLTPTAESAANVAVTLDRIRGVRTVFSASGGVIAPDSSVEAGIVAGHSLLDDPVGRPTAVVAQSDLLAAGVIRAAAELGLSVPDDLSVVGFDGIGLDRVIAQDLTTMAQPAAEEGRTAGRAVLDMLDGGRPAPMRFRCRFHRGATIAPPR